MILLHESCTNTFFFTTNYKTTKTNKTAKTKTTFFVQLKLMYKQFVNFNL